MDVTDNSAPRLRVVSRDGVRRPREIWRCPVCAAAERPSGALIAVALEAEVIGERIVPGEAGFACMVCFSKGIVTLV